MSYSSRVLRACALLALPTAAFAQSTKGPTVFSPAAQVGTVNLRAAIVLQDYTVKPLPLLKVVARSADRPDSVAAQTDLDGRTTLTLTVGVYTVRARTPQPVGGRMYEWAVKVVVRPQQSQSMDLTNSNASRSDSVATTPTVVAEAKPAPQPPPPAASQPAPVQPTATAAAAVATAAAVAQPQTSQTKAPAPKTTQSTTAQAKTAQPQPAQQQAVATQPVTTQSAAPKTVASQPSPAPAAPTKASTPPKAEAAVATAAVTTAAVTTAAAKSTTSPKPVTPATATPPSTADKAVVVKPEPPKSAPAPVAASATQSSAPATSTQATTARPAQTAAAQSSVPVSKHTDVAARPRPRTNTSGLMVGLAFDASSIRSDDLNSRTESGPGVAGMIGWGITKNIAIALDASGAQISSVDGNYNLGHADIGARWHFVNRTAFVPFVDVGYAGRALMKRDVTLTDDLGNTSTGTLTYMGAGLSYGGGLNYFITPGVAFGGAFKWTTGRFSEVRFENLTVQDLQLDASSARFNMGFTWYPMGRR